MRFKSQLTIDMQVDSKSDLIHDLFKEIDDYIQCQDYGDGIYEYFISASVVNPPSSSEHLIKNFKPKFTKHKEGTNRYTGEKYEINRTFHYSIVIKGDLYHRFAAASESECKRIVADEIL